METVKILEVLSVGLVGYTYKDGWFPKQAGNCFSVKCDNGETYKVVNFVHENYENLVNVCGIKNIKLKPLSRGVGCIHDTRIPNKWYLDRWCGICCPIEHLPIGQQMERERASETGVYQVTDSGMTITDSSKNPKPMISEKPKPDMRKYKLNFDQVFIPDLKDE